MHVSPVKGTAQVKFKVVDGTERTLSMPMLVANGHRLVYRGEDTMLRTAAGEVVPLTSDGDDWYLKVLINNLNKFLHFDVWAAGHECPPSWVRCLSPENVERRTTPASTTITKTCMFSPLSLCVGSFRPTSRRRVRDHVNNACLRDILMRSGSRHLVDTCTMVDCRASSCTHIKPFG